MDKLLIHPVPAGRRSYQKALDASTAIGFEMDKSGSIVIFSFRR